MKSLRFVSISLGLAVVGISMLPVACGDTTAHPPPLAIDQDSGFLPPLGDGSVVPHDSGSFDASDSAVIDAPVDTGPDTADAGPPGCNDGVKDNLETDVDCGGPACAKCIDGKVCIAAADCVGGSCIANDGGTGNVCITPSCTDKIQDGQETDVDCGGPTCPHCTLGKKCGAGADCVSDNCVANGVGNACACPARMVVVATSAALGGAYCVDATEVDYGQYNAFVQANQPIATQITQCLANTTFVPSANWPPPQPTPNSFSYPIRDVDWCDAYAFCKWAGKQLCGQIGGGSVAQSGANDITKSAWYNACSAQGVNTYPYNVSTFNPSACNGTGPDGGPGAPWKTYDYAANGPANVSCQGGTVGLFQMSGNVAEWEDSCDGTTGIADSCSLRGGSFDSGDSPTALACAAARTATRGTYADDVGFRCCQY